MLKLEDLIQLRREFHQIAETGWLEFKTTIKIINYLKSYGYSVEYGKGIHGERMGLPTDKEMEEQRNTVKVKPEYDISEILEGYTGVVGTFDTGKEGPIIAMRFDIDANGIEETYDSSHIPTAENFRSKSTKAMHACGHDGHITIGLSVAQWIMEKKDDLKGKFILLFQPAEEGVRGAKSMVEAGVLEGIEYFLSGHIGLGSEPGILALGTIGFLATTKIDIFFEGEPAHAGANPELGKNALLAAANCAINLHTLPQIGLGMSRLNVGFLQAGTSRNIVPNKAKMQIETRGENEKINELLKIKVANVIEGAAKTFDVKYNYVLAGGAPAYNSYNEEFVKKLEHHLKEEGFNTVVGRSLGGSEDASYMMNEVESNGGEAMYFLFGTNLAAPHHNNKFDFDEEVLMTAYKAFTSSIEMLMK